MPMLLPSYLQVLLCLQHHVSLSRILSNAAQGLADAFQGGGKARKRKLVRQGSSRGRALRLYIAMAGLFM